MRRRFPGKYPRQGGGWFSAPERTGAPAAGPFAGSKGATMFRTAVDDVSLFGGRTAAGPKPSFRPAVEALEERVVLSFTLISTFPNNGEIPVLNAAGPEVNSIGTRFFANLSPPLVWHN